MMTGKRAQDLGSGFEVWGLGSRDLGGLGLKDSRLNMREANAHGAVRSRLVTMRLT